MKKLSVKTRQLSPSMTSIQDIIEPLRARFPGTIVSVEVDRDLRDDLVVHAYGFHQTAAASQEAVVAACQLVRQILEAGTASPTEPSIDFQEAT